MRPSALFAFVPLALTSSLAAAPASAGYAAPDKREESYTPVVFFVRSPFSHLHRLRRVLMIFPRAFCIRQVDPPTDLTTCTKTTFNVSLSEHWP